MGLWKDMKEPVPLEDHADPVPVAPPGVSVDKNIERAEKLMAG